MSKHSSSESKKARMPQIRPKLPRLTVLIFRNLKNDERDQDKERKFVPKRLGTGMDT